jgi:hypothetical protein
VWLPLQYALTPDQHDSQEKIDELIERAVRRPFTEGNRLSYIVNEQFDFQLGRMIHDADDYHVLWIHDFRGVNAEGKPDEVAYTQVLNSYLSALTAKVRAYDEVGTLPVYMIFIDQWFYAIQSGRLWMDLLENPMNHRLRLPAGFEEWERSIELAQQELRDAVASSRLLQAEAGQYGDRWLHNRIKVHVSITNRGDPTFWNRQILPLIGLTDNAMRDHRKVSFYDITEEDPYRGRAMYTGMGVGEHYTSLNWEDRAVMLQGPAAIGLKIAARQLLLNQGIPEERIPYHLQPRVPAGDAATIAATDAPWVNDARVLELHNETGYNAKSINVAKAILYTLMPPGSVIKTPDSLWNSGFWGGMLVGSALRGARVLAIAPSSRNAPSWGFGQMVRTKEILIRLVASDDILGDEIRKAGGLLRVGVFAPGTPVTDMQSKLGAFIRAYEDEPFIRELFPIHPTIMPVLWEVHAALGEQLAGVEESWTHQEHDGTPKLHLKANFFASAEAWDGFISRPELGSYFQIYMEHRVAQILHRTDALADPGATSERMLEAAMPTLERWEETLEPAVRERLIFYLMLGSANQNYRSMLLDGEVAVVVSGWASIIAVLDFISIMGQSTWVSDLEELEALLPDFERYRRAVGQWLKTLL